MKNNETIRVAVAENSVIIRSGLTLALKRLPNLKIQPVELLSVEALHDCLRTQYPDILVVNPTFGDYFDVARFREETTGKGIRVVALVSSFIDATLLSKYDDSISIFDDLEGMVSIQHTCPEIDFPADTPTSSLITALKQCVSCCLE
jgi:DNA-binding NarL/FixJ family response regulator